MTNDTVDVARDASRFDSKDSDFSKAKRLYAEMFGDAIVTNYYLRLVIVVLFLVIVGLLYTQCYAINMFRGFNPLFVRIDSLGRAEAIRYREWEYHPQEAEIKYFLGEFCRLYYSRNREGLEGNFKIVLTYLSPDLREKVSRAWELEETISKFRDTMSGDIDIEISQVMIEDLRKPPYRGRVDFHQIFYGVRERIEASRVLYTANFVFRFRSGVVTEDILKVNPLGLQIDYWREDLSYDKTRPKSSGSS